MKKQRKSHYSREYWLEKGYHDENIDKMIKSKVYNTFEYYTINKGYTDEEAVELMKANKGKSALTLQKMIDKYGEIEGHKRWESYRHKQSISNTFEYKKDKYGWTVEQFDEYNKSRSVTLENLIKRHGYDLGTKKYNNYVERQRYAGCKIEYFIEKYGIEIGTEKYYELNKKKAITIDNFLAKYDNNIEIATAKYLEWIAKLSNPVSYSSISQELFNAIHDLIKNKFEFIYYYNNNGEWIYYNNEYKKLYMFDFFIKDNGKVIEFNGDYWHANPKKYKETDIISFPNSVTKSASEIWECDDKKRKLSLQCPYVSDYLVIWESDYIKDKKNTIEKCVNYLLS